MDIVPNRVRWLIALPAVPLSKEALVNIVIGGSILSSDRYHNFPRGELTPESEHYSQLHALARSGRSCDVLGGEKVDIVVGGLTLSF